MLCQCPLLSLLPLPPLPTLAFSFPLQPPPLLPSFSPTGACRASCIRSVQSDIEANSDVLTQLHEVASYMYEAESTLDHVEVKLHETKRMLQVLHVPEPLNPNPSAHARGAACSSLLLPAPPCQIPTRKGAGLCVSDSTFANAVIQPSSGPTVALETLSS
jgi:hypothetical protein